MDNAILILVFRWLHIVPATILVGGTIFLRCAYQPSEPSSEQSEKVRRRWAKLVMLSVALLLVSGLYNTAWISMKYEFPGGYYHMLLGIKIVLALAVFFLVSVLSGRSELATKFRDKEKTWLNVTVFLAVAVVLVAGVMKMAKRDVKAEDDKGSSRHGAPLDPVERV